MSQKFVVTIEVEMYGSPNGWEPVEIAKGLKYDGPGRITSLSVEQEVVNVKVQEQPS